MRVLALAGGLVLVGCSPSNPDFEAGHIAGCSHDNVLPELKLTTEHKRLLAKRTDPPRTALDYYLSLPASFFGNIEDTAPERRASFIDLETLTDQWLEARHFFDCDGGGFEVVMRVFDADPEPVIAIKAWGRDPLMLLEDQNASRGELKSISVRSPGIWRFAGGTWMEAKEIAMPIIEKDKVIDRYRNHYKAHLKLPDQPKYVWLNYKLPKLGNEFQLIGRENFMDPDGDYVWQVLRFDGKSFVEVPLKD